MLKTLIAAFFMASAAPALAALKPGDKAPDFTLPATLGGNEFTFHMAQALKKAPWWSISIRPPSPRAAP